MQKLVRDPESIGDYFVVDVTLSKEELRTKLIAAILDWWEQEEYRVCGAYGEYNVYDTTPQFVESAKKGKDLLTITQESLQWWKDHEYDFETNDEGDSCNIYDETPEFISVAEEALK